MVLEMNGNRGRQTPKKLEMDEMYKRRSKYIKELTMGTRKINLPSILFWGTELLILISRTYVINYTYKYNEVMIKPFLSTPSTYG